jgi:Domain of unknown function (DUF222)
MPAERSLNFRDGVFVNIHDAVKLGLRYGISSGESGIHRGLPVTVIATTTLDELDQAARAAHDPDVRCRRRHAPAETADCTFPLGQPGSLGLRPSGLRVRPGWIVSPWLWWRTMAWTACCVSCVMAFARVVIARRLRVGWRWDSHGG